MSMSPNCAARSDITWFVVIRALSRIELRRPYVLPDRADVVEPDGAIQGRAGRAGMQSRNTIAGGRRGGQRRARQRGADAPTPALRQRADVVDAGYSGAEEQRARRHRFAIDEAKIVAERRRGSEADGVGE